MSAPLLRFFNAAGNGIGSVYEFVGFQNVVVPAGAASLNAYFTDSRMDDNTGGCTFDLEIDPFTDVDCADGSDNDGDGRIDFCLADGSNAATCDDGCAVPEDMSEIPHDETCTGPDGLEGCDEQADQIDIPPTRCLGTGSGGPSCPSCGSCSKGSCGGSMYGAVAADGSTPVVDEMRQDIPNFDAIFGKGTGYDDATSLRTCNLLGYANFCCKYWHGYSHPFDENVIMYDAVNGVWISRSNAGNAVGGCNKRLKCSHPLPRCSNNLDDDGDCLVDFPDDAGCADATDDDERGGSSGGGDGQDVDGEIAPVTWQMQ